MVLAEVALRGREAIPNPVLALGNFDGLHRGHITTRENFQFHFVNLDDTAEVMRIIGAAGLTTREACAHTVRNITGSPYAGIAADEEFGVEDERVEAHVHRALDRVLHCYEPQVHVTGRGGGQDLAAEPLAPGRGRLDGLFVGEALGRLEVAIGVVGGVELYGGGAHLSGVMPVLALRYGLPAGDFMAAAGYRGDAARLRYHIPTDPDWAGETVLEDVRVDCAVKV